MNWLWRLLGILDPTASRYYRFFDRNYRRIFRVQAVIMVILFVGGLWAQLAGIPQPKAGAWGILVALLVAPSGLGLYVGALLALSRQRERLALKQPCDTHATAKQKSKLTRRAARVRST